MNKVYILISLFVFLITGQVSFGEEVVKIVSIYAQDLTAIEAFVTSEDIKGVRIAVDEINSRGGFLGKKVELINIPIANSIQAKIKMIELLKTEKIIAVIGSNTSSSSLAMAPLIQEREIPMISPVSTNIKVTLAGDYIFRACFTDPFQGKMMARFALDDLKAKNAALLIKINSSFSTSVSEFFKEEFAKEGKIIYEGNYLSKDVNFTSTLEKIKEMNPDVVFVPGHGRDSALILKQAHRMGIDSVFLGADGWGKGLLGIAGSETVEGNYFSNHWNIEVEKELNKKFVKKYIEKGYGDKIAASAPLAYDSTMLLAEAIRVSQSLKGNDIKEALQNIKDFKGVTGIYNFDKNGDPIDKEGVVLKYENGEIKFFKSVKP